MAKKVYEEENIRAIAEKIREKTGKDATYKTSEMPEGVERVYEAGSQAENDRFWDIYQQNGNLTNYENLFCGKGWTTQNFKPKYDIKPTNAYMIFRNATNLNVDLVEYLVNLGVTLDFSNCTNLNYGFSGATFTRLGVIDISNCTGLGGAFSAGELKTIDKLIISEKTVGDTGMFEGARKLENLTIEGVISKDFSVKNCSLLTQQSLMSIINALKDFGIAEIQCEFQTGPFNNQVTNFREKYEIVNMDDSCITVATDDYGDIPVSLYGDFKATEYSNATHVVFNNSSSFTLYLPIAIATKTLTLGSTNLAKLTDEEKKKATAKGWELK